MDGGVIGIDAAVDLKGRPNVESLNRLVMDVETTESLYITKTNENTCNSDRVDSGIIDDEEK